MVITPILDIIAERAVNSWDCQTVFQDKNILFNHENENYSRGSFWGKNDKYLSIHQSKKKSYVSWSTAVVTPLVDIIA